IPIAGTWSGFLRDAALGWLARRTRARVIGHQHAGDIDRKSTRLESRHTEIYTLSYTTLFRSIPIAGTWSGFLRDAALGWLARRTRARVIGHQHAGDIPQVLARRGRDARLVEDGLR